MSKNKRPRDGGHTTHQPHGFGIRGLSSHENVRRTISPSKVEGGPGCKFGRLLEPDEGGSKDYIPFDFPIRDLHNLASAMDGDATIQDKKDPEESHIPAAYTYFGQFVDHDLTFDPQTFAQQQRDAAGMTNFRTPSFDLDNVYGRGPSDQPYLYDGIKLAVGEPLLDVTNNTGACDLPRAAASRRAIIGDPRNDENVIVSQLQGMILRFHNRLVDDRPLSDFEEIQRLVRWHYQWVVIHDFLTRIVHPDVLNEVNPWIINPDLPNKTKYGFEKIRTMPKASPFMSVEFSVGAYRMGHSMVRPSYRVNEKTPRLPIFHPTLPKQGLNAFGEFSNTWTIDWNRFIDLKGSIPGPDPRTQMAYKIDTSLVDPLAHLPHSVAGDEAITQPALLSLAFRNLRRANILQLPTGQDVARHLRIEPLKDNEILIGAAETGKPDEGKPITFYGDSFAGKCPLWVYILAEARKNFYDGGEKGEARLGSVGGRIVAEVFMRMLELDKESFIVKQPSWRPELADDEAKFTLAHLINKALTGLPLLPPAEPKPKGADNPAEQSTEPRGLVELRDSDSAMEIVKN